MATRQGTSAFGTPWCIVMVKKSRKEYYSRQHKRQKARKQYSKAREKAQLLDIIPTVPDGAIRDERVDPSTQSKQLIPSLDQKAVRNGWAVPEHEQPQLVDRLVQHAKETE